MAYLVDTNVLVYRFDPRDAVKQKKASTFLRAGLGSGEVRVPHQALVEFIAATTRPLGTDRKVSLLEREEAAREAEEMIVQFPVLYPTEEVLRLAFQGWRTYELNWFDAHIWAYAEYYGLSPLYSEDFQHGRLYGRVRAINPFAE